MNRLAKKWGRVRKPGYQLTVISALIALLAWSNNPALAADRPLAPFTATYVVKKGSLTLGELTRTLSQKENGVWLVQSDSKTTGYARLFTKVELSEQSEWIYHNGQMRPLHYRYDRTRTKRKRHIKLHFDWEKRRVINEINGDPWQMEVPERTLDKLLYQLAIMHDLNNDRAKEGKLHYQVADGGRLKEYHFEIVGKERLRTELGNLNTLKIKRIGGKRKTTFWCSIDHDFMLVRIKQEDKHGTANLFITSLDQPKATGNPPKP